MAMNRRGFITSAVAGLAAGAAGGALAARSEMGLFAPAQGKAIFSGNVICTTWKRPTGRPGTCSMTRARR